VPANNVLLHLRNYLSAGTLSALAGIITFPLLTRNLSVEEYGILGLITATVTLFIAIGKMGFQHSVIRFYSLIEEKNSEWDSAQMYTTVFTVFGVLAVLTTIFWLVFGVTFVPRNTDYQGVLVLYIVAAGIVFFRILGSSLLNFLRASHRSGTVAKVQIIQRFLYLGLLLLLLFFSGIEPLNVLLCLLSAEIVAFVYSLWRYRDKMSLAARSFKPDLARVMLAYGMPLMILESLGVLLRLTDRYLIQGILGEAELGMYSASYNLTGYLEIVILATVAQAIRPLYITIWERDGAEETQSFLSNTFHVYLAIGIPFVAIFSATAPHLMNFLASPKFAPGTVIIPYVTISFILDGALLWLAAGLYVKRNTRALMFWSMIAAVTNLVLNLIAIPAYGILGASIVTVISYVIFIGGCSLSAWKHLSFSIDWVTPIIIAVMSFAVYLLLMQLDFGTDLIDLFAKGVIGVLLCMAGLWAIDAKLKTLVLEYLEIRANKGGVA